MADESEAPAAKPLHKKRSGSEKRQRTDVLTLRLLPSERSTLQALATQAGHRSVQAWLLAAIGPQMEQASRR